MSVVKLDRKARPRALTDYPDVLDLHDVAEILRRSEDRTRQWLRSGAIHSVKVGGQHRVSKQILIAFLAGDEVQTTAP